MPALGIGKEKGAAVFCYFPYDKKNLEQERKRVEQVEESRRIMA